MLTKRSSFRTSDLISMKRRDFVLTVGGLGVASLSAYYLFYVRDVKYDPALASPQSLSTIWDRNTIELIGKQYRSDVPAENRERSLVRLLTADASTGQGIADPLYETTINDFKTGKTVLVDGWILSQTEARQCALASIAHAE